MVSHVNLGVEIGDVVSEPESLDLQGSWTGRGSADPTANL